MTARPALDRFRLTAAVLVVCIHTGPLASFTAAGDFWLTRVLARTAVPFFFMTSGYFLGRRGWSGTGRFVKKALLLYGAAAALYLPVNWYNGGYTPREWLQKLLEEGTLYHLWYFPAVILGVLIARNLARLGMPAALTAAGALYLLGVGGDSWYGFAVHLPAAEEFYRRVFQVVSHTRNGLFFAPLFLLLGAAGKRWSRRASLAGGLFALALMTAEASFLRRRGWPRHDSMYLTLPLCMALLFSLLLGENRGEDRRTRRLSALVYLLHPLAIVLVRGAAGAAGLRGPLVDNSLGHFCAVLAATALLALTAEALQSRLSSGEDGGASGEIALPEADGREKEGNG